MKRKFILLPITLTALAPAISLVGCGDPDKPEEETKFTTTTGEMSSETEATFDLDWANGHSLTFGTNWEFTTNVGSVQSVATTGGDTRPQTISIIFSSEITTEITDGKLKFTYNDLTTKKDNISTTIENICITKYSPEPEYIDISMTLSDDSYVSETRTFEKNNRYKFCFSSWAFDYTHASFAFYKNDERIQASVTIDNLYIGGYPTRWTRLSPPEFEMFFDVPKGSSVEIYLTINKTFTDATAMSWGENP